MEVSIPTAPKSGRQDAAPRRNSVLSRGYLGSTDYREARRPAPAPEMVLTVLAGAAAAALLLGMAIPGLAALAG